ncbi:uncharacterized protein [Ptychodera flava]|uniref:uncharacterized protein n=1 Tax=Ptychodera flava TaxID=63121 RepID=UPI00396A118C
MQSTRLVEKADVPGVLVVFDKWDIERYGFAQFQRNLMQIFARKKGEGIKVYFTILDVTVSESQKKDAEKAGITLIPARRAEHLDPESDPINILWLSYPAGYYPQLKDLPNIQYVIGYAPMTAKAAANIRRTVFPQAKLYQINAVHPDYHTNMTSEQKSTLEGDMLDIAREADAMVSIGPSMHAYFENAYRAISDKSISHIEILPKVYDCFQKQTIELQKDIQQHVILSYGHVDCHADIMSDYSKIASVLGEVAAAQEEVCGHSIKWNILDVPKESIDKREKDLKELTRCGFKLANLKPTATIIQLLTHLQQSHLCVIGSPHSDFGFYGLETIAAGLPTYADRDSQLGNFIIKYFKSYKDLFLVRSEQEWHDKVMAAVEDTETALKWANELKKAYLECKEVDQSYDRFAALFTEEKAPSEDFPVTIELNAQPWKQRLKELREQREMVSRQRPDDQTTLDALTQEIQKISESLLRCKQTLKRKADQIIEDGIEELKRLCCDANVGVNQVTKITIGSLGMLINFLSILGLYRFKSSVQTGRFAELYEPWLITDEMREIAAKVNLPLKLQVTYDEKKFDELDVFFIKRDGGISDFLRHVGDENGYGFLKGPESSLLVEQQSLPSNKANTNIEERIPLARRLVFFKLDQLLQSQRVTTQWLAQILNIGNSADIKHITCDVIQVPVEVTERIRHILLAKQEILSLLGIRAFLVTDREGGQLITEALDAQFEKHGTKVSATTTTDRSLLVRGLLLFDTGHSKVDSCCDLYFLDLEEIGTQRYRQTQVLKAQEDKERVGKYSLEEQHKKTLKELDRAIKEVKYLKDELDDTLKNRDEIEKQWEKTEQEAKLFKTQLDQVKEGKSVSDKLSQERLEELDKVEKIASEKVIEIASLKKKIQNLETKLAQSSDLMTKMKAQLSNAETELAESRDLVAKMQVKLSDAENKALESDTLRDQLDKTKKEVAQLIDQLEIAVQEKDEIQEELDRGKKEKSLPQTAGTETSKLEKDVKGKQTLL